MKKFVCIGLSVVMFFTGIVCLANNKTTVTGTQEVQYSVVSELEKSSNTNETVASDLSIVQQGGSIESSSGTIWIPFWIIGGICWIAGVGCWIAGLVVGQLEFEARK